MRSIQHHFVKIFDLITIDLPLLLQSNHHLLLQTIPELCLAFVGNSQHGHTSLEPSVCKQCKKHVSQKLVVSTLMNESRLVLTHLHPILQLHSKQSTVTHYTSTWEEVSNEGLAGIKPIKKYKIFHSPLQSIHS